MEKVTSYKISDGRIFEDKEEAEKEEFAIKLRGIIQSAYHPGATVTITQAVEALAKNQDAVFTLLSRYRKAVKAATK